MNPKAIPLPLRRQAAAKAVVARYRGAALKLGVNDCVRMAGLALRRMGHKVDLPKYGAYGSMGGALKILRARGFASIEAALDAMGLARVPLASAQAADIIGVPGEDGWTALWVCVGNGRAIGWHASSDKACIIQPTTDAAIVWSAAHG